MANPPSEPGTSAASRNAPADHLDMPPDRRALAEAHAAMLARTARRVALEVPFAADVDDFRRVLAEGARL